MRVAIFAACLLMTASLIPPGDASVIDDFNNEKCKSWDQDQNPFGGATVECTRGCEANSILSIEVYSHDNEGKFPASVSGEFSCGGEVVSCAEGDGTCSDTGNGLTTFEDPNGACSAVSDEFWTSKLEVICAYDPTTIDTDWCPVAEPVPVCIDPLPDIIPPGNEPPTKVSPRTVIYMVWDPIQNEVIGERCDRFGCDEFLPLILDNGILGIP